MKIFFTLLAAGVLGHLTPCFAQGLVIASGNGQVVSENFATTTPMTVRAVDAAGRPVPNKTVSWSITQGQGSLFVYAPQTDANGLAKADFIGANIPPGTSFLAANVTASSIDGLVVFIVTTSQGRSATGGQIAPPAVQLVTPLSYSLTGAAGSTLPGAILVKVIAQGGIQLGQGVPNVGLRVRSADSTMAPPASCDGPSGLVLTDQTGLATCNLVLGQTPGIYQIQGLAGEYQNTPLISLTITPGQACNYSITPTNQSFGAGAGTASVTVSTSQTCTWTALSNATWLSVTSGTSGTGQGNVAVSIAANTTGAGRSGTLTIASQTFTVTQAATGPGPGPAPNTLSFNVGAALPSATAGLSYSVSLTASGGVPPYVWSTTSALPAGLSLNTSTGLLSGAVQTAGQYSFSVSVRDAANTSVSQTFSLSASAATGGSSLQISTSSFANGTVGTAYEQPVTTSGGCTNPFSPQPVVSLASGSFPGGLSLRTPSPSGFGLAGVPTAAGTFSFTLRALDGCNASTTRSYTLVISAVGGGGVAAMTATPASLSFTTTLGSLNPPAAQTVALDTGATPIPFTAEARTATGGSWLVAAPATGSTPANISVSVVNANTLAAGTYNGSVVITSTASNSPVTIPVTLTLAAAAAPAITVAPLSLTFDVGLLGTPGVSQGTLNVSSAAPGLAFNTTTITFNGGGWLTALPGSGSTPSTVNVFANPAGLAAGFYTGSVAITPIGNSAGAVTVPVTLNVGATAGFTASPAALRFEVTPLGTAPAVQVINVGSNGAALNFTAATNAPWVTITPASGATPAALSVSINPAGLQAGDNAAIITITPSPSGTPVNIAVTATLGGQDLPVVTATTNAASFAPGPVAPGELITIFGRNLGGATLLQSRTAPDGRLETMLGDTRVLFDGVAAPLIYVSANQVSAIVPYEMRGRNTAQLRIERQNYQTNPTEVRIVDAVPGIFVLDASGQGAILNQDFSVNGIDKAAQAGSVISIYATGEGETSPSGVSGRITPVVFEELARPILPVTAQVGAAPAEVLYAGSAPGLPAGVLQVNVRIPSTAAAGSVPILINVGGFSSQPGVFVTVRQ